MLSFISRFCLVLAQWVQQRANDNIHTVSKIQWRYVSCFMLHHISNSKSRLFYRGAKSLAASTGAPLNSRAKVHGMHLLRLRHGETQHLLRSNGEWTMRLFAEEKGLRSFLSPLQHGASFIPHCSSEDAAFRRASRARDAFRVVFPTF